MLFEVAVTVIDYNPILKLDFRRSDLIPKELEKSANSITITLIVSFVGWNLLEPNELWFNAGDHWRGVNK